MAEEKHLPLYKELTERKDVEYIAGGATQNALRVAAWMSGKTKKLAFIGCVGKDEYGTRLEEEMTKDGVTPIYLKDEKTPTGTCAVLINGGERSLVANLAAANEYKVEHLEGKERTAVMESANMFYISGFFLTVSPPSMIRVGKHAAETNKVFCLNLSAPFIPAVFKDALSSVIPYADYVFGNETEAASWGAANDMEGKSIKEIAQAIANLDKVNEKRPRTVIITQGKDPVVVATKEGITTFNVKELPKEKLVDTNGAGDAFVGGFLAGMMRGAELEKCVEAGNYSARVIIQRSGCSCPEKLDWTW